MQGGPAQDTLPGERRQPARLSQLRAGARARVLGYEKSDPAYRKRLLAMGLTRGAELELVRIAPLGDPVQIRVRGCVLSVRKAEAGVLRLETL